ncbi:MAG: peptide ABC transporter substrate-binding protein [Chloroflexi bacterium]|nr:peptide ABC transporter substrate-binding protein [Chloroflexota bacterium]
MKRGLSFLLLATALFLLMGCARAAPTPAKPAAGALAATQELRINLAGEPDTIDPNRASFSTEITPIKLSFRGLLSFNDKLEVVPVIATEVPTVKNGGISSDGLTYTFKLRKGVTWSDGKPVTAKDIEYSIKRMLKPETAAEYASFYHDIKGGKGLNTAKATTDALLGAVAVKAVDDSTLRITLENPRPSFLQIMALWPAYPLRQDIIEKFGDKWTEPANYVSNGPFILTEWVHQDHMTFQANPKYWGPKPKLQKIVLKMVKDVNAELAAYKSNELDMARVPPGTEKATMSDPALSKEILRYPELVTFALQFNVKKPPFDSKAVRRALSMSIDREAFVNQVRNGVGRPTTSWVPPGMPGFDANLGSESKFDAAKAKQGLAAAGFPDVSKLPPITFHFTDSAGNRLIAQFVQGQFKQNLGIDIKLEPLESKAFQQLVKQNDFHMAYLGWGADYPDPDNWLPELWGTGTGNNHTNYSNPDFDKLAEQAKKELDSTKRLQLWAQAQKMVVDDAPVIFFFNRERFWLKKPNVAGLKVTGMDASIPGDWFLDEVYITR